MALPITVTKLMHGSYTVAISGTLRFEEYRYGDPWIEASKYAEVKQCASKGEALRLSKQSWGSMVETNPDQQVRVIHTETSVTENSKPEWDDA